MFINREGTVIISQAEASCPRAGKAEREDHRQRGTLWAETAMPLKPHVPADPMVHEVSHADRDIGFVGGSPSMNHVSEA